MKEISRRRLIQTGAASALASAAMRQTPAGRERGRRHGPKGRITDAVLEGFDRDVREAMETFGMVGAGVALFQGDRIVYNEGFGLRNLRCKEPVTLRTRFRVGSNTKSMTSMLLARLVDMGMVRWNTRAVESGPSSARPPRADPTSPHPRPAGHGFWPGRNRDDRVLRLRGRDSALDLLRSIPYQEVIAPPATEYAYNNALVSAAIHLVLLARGTKPAALEEAYAAAMRRHVFEPTDGGRRERGGPAPVGRTTPRATRATSSRARCARRSSASTASARPATGSRARPTWRAT